jgi:hypothetical protein
LLLANASMRAADMIMSLVNRRIDLNSWYIWIVNVLILFSLSINHIVVKIVFPLTLLTII